MPICTKCSLNKNEDEFSFKNKKRGKLNSRCKTCHSKYVKNHYETHKEKYINRAKRNKSNEIEKTKSLIEKLKPCCVVCGETWTAALDLHHIDSSNKEESIAKLTSRKKMIEESKKCIVLCATDHRKFHSGHSEVIKIVNAYVAQSAGGTSLKTRTVSVQI